MSRGAHHLAIIIPTKDHPEELGRLLQSLSEQTVLPDEVIVVDGGAQPLPQCVASFPALRIRCTHVSPPGLARQQNVGRQLVDPVMTLVGLLDDDMVLEADALEVMLSFWSTAAPTVGGVAFNLVNNTASPRWVWLKALFGMDASRRGTFLPSGYQVKIGAVQQDTTVEWLYSGATVWRKAVLDAFAFDEWFEGPGFLYEVEFSLRVGRQYQMMVVADAHVREVESGRQWDGYRLGRWQVLNRLYVVRKHRGTHGLSVERCYTALACQLFVNLARGILEWDRQYVARAVGNFQGFLEARRWTAAPHAVASMASETRQGHLANAQR
ncbi:MAG: glycosyltransferase family 2 protein [Candidatus Omnitrophica bacterium]|nr:glycosyltransferase family 2 protein [Candidatus Omnitrophota bacterium]